MKTNNFYILLLAVSMLSIFSCNWLKPRKTPEEVAVAFNKAVANLDLDEAVAHCEPETAKLVNNLIGLVDNMSQDRRKESREKVKFIQSATCTIKDNIALCQVCCDDKGMNLFRATTLRRQPDGCWLLFMDKEVKRE